VNTFTIRLEGYFREQRCREPELYW